MVADGMLTRQRYREVPPRVDYELTPRARELMPVLAELARWGYEWAWSAPRGSETIDLGAIFRLAPGLVQAPGATGTIELAVTGDEEGESAPAYTLTLSDGRATIEEHGAERPDARISGDRSSWIGAFSPDRDREGLSVSGDAELAHRALDALMCAASGAGAQRAVA
jgi:hypothetical protein